MQLYVAYTWYAEDQSAAGHGYCILDDRPVPVTDEDVQTLIEKINEQERLSPGTVAIGFWAPLPGRRN